MVDVDKLPHKSVPHGITFGSKVVKLPDTSQIFNRALWIQACIQNPVTLGTYYTWIDRGSNLAKYIILTHKIGIGLFKFITPKDLTKIFLRSPVSGLLIHCGHYFGDADNSSCRTTLLLPDDEPPAENGEFMFGQLCNFGWDHRESIFMKPTEFRNSNAFSDASLKSSFKEQVSRVCQVSDALPKFNESFQEARTRHPELRPYLKHLL